MSDRPIWRGHLRLALVSCPVALFTARKERGGLHFHLINPDTGNRVHMVTQDAETEAPLSRGELVKGYEFRKHEYVVLTEEDFATARVESSSTLNIDKFVPEGSIDPVYTDATYFLLPDGKAGADVYAVVREAMAARKRIALSRVVIAQRERPVAISAVGRGLVLHTLHSAEELIDPAEAFAELPALKSEPDMVKLATQLIDRQTGNYDPADQEDRYEARLRALIDAKVKGEGLDPPPADRAPADNVIDLMAALKRSLGEADKPARSTAKPAAKKSAAKQPAPKRSPAPKAAPAAPARRRKA